MMDINQLKILLDNFRSNVSNDITYIEAMKQEIAQMKSDIYNSVRQGKFIRDDNRIVLSAPEIVIGNVDDAGNLIGADAAIVVRGKRVEVDGVGNTGVISCKAPTIEHIAVDTGNDGRGSIVHDTSQIVSQARSITLASYDASRKQGCQGVFPLVGAAADGIHLHADAAVTIEAAKAGTKLRDDIQHDLQIMDQDIAHKSGEVGQAEQRAGQQLAAINQTLNGQLPYLVDELLLRANAQNLKTLNDNYQQQLTEVVRAMDEYFAKLSELAELMRQKSSLQDAVNTLMPADAAAYKTHTTQSHVTINSESVYINSIDADGNLRTTTESGVYVNACHINMTSYDIPDLHNMTNTLLPYSNISLSASAIDINTDNLSNMDIQASTFEAEHNPVGTVNINAKHVNIESTRKKIKEAFTIRGDQVQAESTEQVLGYPTDPNNDQEKGRLLLKGNNIMVAAISHENKADGTITLNAKQTELTAIDKKGIEGEAGAPTQGSTVTVFSDQVFLGSMKGKTDGQLVQTKSKSLGMFVAEKATIQGNNSILQLNGDKADISAQGGVTLYGKTTVKADAEFGSNVKVPSGQVTANFVHVGTGFESPKYKDNIQQTAAESNTEMGKAELKPQPEENNQVEQQ